jgi:hypothetical protein
MTNAAEIIRYTSAGWTASGISRFSSILNNVFYPRLNSECLTEHTSSENHAEQIIPVYNMRQTSELETRKR